MKLSFNEISFQPFADSEAELFDIVDASLKNYDLLVSKFNFNHIIAPEEVSAIKVLENTTFSDWFKSLDTPKRNRVQLLFLRRPFSEEALGDETPELSRYFIEYEESKIPQQYCKGLATAYLLEIPSLSISTHNIWDEEIIRFSEYSDDLNDVNQVECLNISAKTINEGSQIITYYEKHKKIELVDSVISVAEKKISLRDDHGKDILKAFGKKLINHKYVNNIINSLPFNPKTNRFIKRISKDGLVEIVLYWEDAGYGIVVETTGRNLDETEKIAKLLRTEFDK
ncbi:MAG: hypothetical protein JJE55_14645 [Flavobacteriaceae bacterium]|nr:hypothetical protein [Flavobacteriaceae bacterium]